MRSRLFATILVLTLILGASASAQELITVLDIQHTVDFGHEITFDLLVRTQEGVSQVELIFLENGAPDSLVVPARLDREDTSAVVHATATIDLTRYALTPFARAFYTWRITDREGNVLEVDSIPFQYDDSRFTWETRRRENENINLHTYDRPTDQVQAALDQALAAQARIEQQLLAPAPAVIDIYLYNSVEDLRTGLNLHGRDAIEGYADPRHNVILISARRTYAELDLRRQLPHELAHIYIGNIADEAFVPAWLSEGLALFFEAEPDAELGAVFAESAQDGTLYPLEALCPAFPLDRSGFALAYAQSYEVVHYIENRHGPRGLRDLLDAYAQGATCRGGVAQGLGTSLEALERDWLLSLGEEEALPPEPSILPWVVLLLVFAVWPAVMLTFGWARAPKPGVNKPPTDVGG